MGLARGQVGLSKLTLPVDNPLVGRRISDLPLPDNAALITVLRAGSVILPQPDDVLGPATKCCSSQAVPPRIRSAP